MPKTSEMTVIEVLLKQTESAYDWTNKLIASVPSKWWDNIADGVESNISWQVGHQTISIYYHTIMTTVGHIPELIEKLNLRRYTKMCGYDTFAKDMTELSNTEELKEDLKIMQEKSIEVITSLSENDLLKAVEITKIPHPVAKTKFDAIDWNIKHTMWHCGQMATLKRIVDRPYDYGLQKPN